MDSTHTHTASEGAPPDEFLAIGETARALGVSVGTIRRWETEGRIQSARTPGGQRRFSRSEIDRVKRGEAATA